MTVIKHPLPEVRWPDAVTAAQALDAARRFLEPDRLVVIAVGDRSAIEADLRALDLGDVEFRDAQARIQ